MDRHHLMPICYALIQNGITYHMQWYLMLYYRQFHIFSHKYADPIHANWNGGTIYLSSFGLNKHLD